MAPSAVAHDIITDIPAGTIAVPCPGCRQDVYFVAQPSGVRMPLEVIVGDNATFTPSDTDARTPHDGRGRPHLSRCRGR